MLKLTFPQRRDEIIRFVKKHHYSRRCPGVWSTAYCIENDNGKIQAVAMYGPAPYPTVARAFVRNPEHVKHHIWQSRLVGQGISSDSLDQLIYFANDDLYTQGFWWVHTLTNPTESLVDAAIRLTCKGFTGEVYQRTNAIYLGTAGNRALAGFLIDGKPVHIRQGSVTLTHSNVREMYPNTTIRPFYSEKKQRWAYILAQTSAEREARLLLMSYRPQPYQMLRQPRLLIEIYKLLILLSKQKALSQ